METLDKHFRQLTQGVFQKHGFAQQELLSRWSDIAGSAAAHCRPDRIRWPRGGATDDDGKGGTLFLTAYAGRGLDVQHAAAQIIERTNQFLGYQAITAVKVVQGHSLPPVATHSARTEIEAETQKNASITGVNDPGLKSALERLAAGVARSGLRSPQAK